MESVRQILTTYDGKLIDCCYEVRMWMNELEPDDQVKAFRELAELCGTVNTDKTYVIPNSIPEKEFLGLRNSYGSYVDELLSATLKKGYQMGLDEDDFYRLLWNNIVSSNIFVSDTEQAFALYYMVIDRRLPYFYLDHGVTMENEEFKKYMKQNEYAIRRIRFILYNEFSQKTEESSLLIKELNQLDGSEDQIVVMAALLDTLRDDIKRLKKRIRQISGDQDD